VGGRFWVGGVLLTKKTGVGWASCFTFGPGVPWGVHDFVGGCYPKGFPAGGKLFFFPLGGGGFLFFNPPSQPRGPCVWGGKGGPPQRFFQGSNFWWAYVVWFPPGVVTWWGGDQGFLFQKSFFFLNPRGFGIWGGKQPSPFHLVFF